MRSPQRFVCYGVAAWKHRYIARFLGGRDVVFTADAAAAVKQALKEGRQLVVWASKYDDEVAARCSEVGLRSWLLEDGFLRSVGLGANLLPPASLVIDKSGIYYNPQSASDLETMLNQQDFPADLLARASRLRTQIVKAQVSKYNTGSATSMIPPEGRRVILVPGQVEDDASILKGAVGAIRTNADLLTACRTANPQAYIIYKPHPDVEAGQRRGHVSGSALSAANAVAVRTDPISLILLADELWTMTSLMGFEALMHGLNVTCAGQPFYAGWGLTQDLTPHPRRNRPRSLDELVAAALILYPRYRDPRDGQEMTPEDVVSSLASRTPGYGGLRAWLVSTLWTALGALVNSVRR